MKYITSFFLLLILTLYTVVSGYTQDTQITVQYNSGIYGTPYTFITNAPKNTYSWELSIAEYDGREIYSYKDTTWGKNGFTWEPSDAITLYSGASYIATIIFSDQNQNVIQTLAKRFNIPLQIVDNRTPLLFFLGNTTTYAKKIYGDSPPPQILDLIANEANGTFKNSKILVRGHAAFVTKEIEQRKKEQFTLLELSKERALKIITELSNRGVDTTRMYYNALGGSEEISTYPAERWKNRRVEVVFINDITRIKKALPLPQSPSSKENTKKNNILPQKSPQATSPKPLSSPSPEETINKKTSPQIKEDNSSLISIVPSAQKEDSFAILNKRVVDPWPDTPILGKGQLLEKELTAFVLYNSPGLNPEYVRRIAHNYIIEARRERLNYDVAFAQMLIETDYLEFPGNIKKAQYNFAGLRTINEPKESLWFSTEQIGIRAHIQHLKGFATTSPLIGALVDTEYVGLEQQGLLGSASTVSTLVGRWSSDPQYGTKILTLMRQLYNFVNAWNSLE